MASLEITCCSCDVLNIPYVTGPVLNTMRFVCKTWNTKLDKNCAIKILQIIAKIVLIVPFILAAIGWILLAIGYAIAKCCCIRMNRPPNREMDNQQPIATTRPSAAAAGTAVSDDTGFNTTQVILNLLTLCKPQVTQYSAVAVIRYDSNETENKTTEETNACAALKITIDPDGSKTVQVLHRETATTNQPSPVLAREAIPAIRVDTIFEAVSKAMGTKVTEQSLNIQYAVVLPSTEHEKSFDVFYNTIVRNATKFGEDRYRSMQRSSYQHSSTWSMDSLEKHLKDEGHPAYLIPFLGHLTGYTPPATPT